ncbi:hypothetical protein [uncultured Roseobacter sp.]|uniref:hypothetical protein n=1 Tax=uncultured Roseobacter sp. TaxID=114847 RepID=UPI00261F5804|nr:hypothetical protein [uncultured Roseobacter sp.]
MKTFSDMIRICLLAGVVSAGVTQAQAASQCPGAPVQAIVNASAAFSGPVQQDDALAEVENLVYAAPDDLRLVYMSHSGDPADTPIVLADVCLPPATDGKIWSATPERTRVLREGAIGKLLNAYMATPPPAAAFARLAQADLTRLGRSVRRVLGTPPDGIVMVASVGAPALPTAEKLTSWRLIALEPEAEAWAGQAPDSVILLRAIPADPKPLVPNRLGCLVSETQGIAPKVVAIGLDVTDPLDSLEIFEQTLTAAWDTPNTLVRVYAVTHQGAEPRFQKCLGDADPHGLAEAALAAVVAEHPDGSDHTRWNLDGSPLVRAMIDMHKLSGPPQKLTLVSDGRMNVSGLIAISENENMSRDEFYRRWQAKYGESLSEIAGMPIEFVFIPTTDFTTFDDLLITEIVETFKAKR